MMESNSQTQVALLVFVEVARQQRAALAIAMTTGREERPTNLEQNVIVVVAVLQALAALAQVEVRAVTDKTTQQTMSHIVTLHQL